MISHEIQAMQASAKDKRKDESVEQYFKSNKKDRDPETGRNIIKIFSGGWHVSHTQDEMISTILGSCISACIRDPIVKVGGMNHFLLPGSEDMITKAGEAARFMAYSLWRR